MREQWLTALVPSFPGTKGRRKQTSAELPLRPRLGHSSPLPFVGLCDPVWFLQLSKPNRGSYPKSQALGSPPLVTTVLESPDLTLERKSDCWVRGFPTPTLGPGWGRLRQFPAAPLPPSLAQGHLSQSMSLLTKSHSCLIKNDQDAGLSNRGFDRRGQALIKTLNSLYTFN